MDQPEEAWNPLVRIFQHTYEGGVNGTCYECPYASKPLEKSGREAEWRDIANDPTEAYFRCSLPGRNNEEVAWGEYAPCTVPEWLAAHPDATITAKELLVAHEAPGGWVSG